MEVTLRRRNLGNYLFFGVLLPAIGYLAVHFALPRHASPSALEELGIDPTTLDPDTLTPQLAKRLGLHTHRPSTEVVAIVISASFCVANSVKGFHEATRAIPSLINAQLRNRPEAITRAVGIAVDQSPRVGSEYLLKLAEFDEIIAGGNWLNTATEKYFYSGYRLEPAIPQVLILERTVTWSAHSVSLSGEKVLATLNGADSIIAWAKRGAPVEGLARRVSRVPALDARENKPPTS